MPGSEYSPPTRQRTSTPVLVGVFLLALVGAIWLGTLGLAEIRTPHPSLALSNQPRTVASGHSIRLSVTTDAGITVAISAFGVIKTGIVDRQGHLSFRFVAPPVSAPQIVIYTGHVIRRRAGILAAPDGRNRFQVVP